MSTEALRQKMQDNPFPNEQVDPNDRDWETDF